ncbi:MAG: ROK family transcriptional regulator [Acidobacteriota bacterium]
MRKIDIKDFQVARQSTSRDVNRQILLNLLRAHQPVSRADLARIMKTTRGVVGALVNELIEDGLVYDGPTRATSRGRNPTLLYVRTRDRLVVAADVRVSAIDIALCDFSGEPIALENRPPILSPDKFVQEFPKYVKALLRKGKAAELCEGIGIVVPGMADRQSGRVISAPLLGWRDVEIGVPIAKSTGLPVVVESAGKACALSHMWLSHDDVMNTQNFIYITVSDGVGTGLVIDGRLVSGHGGTAGEFGHMAINLDGPRCACGSNGCWMAYISDLATSARYASYLDAKLLASPHSLRTIISLMRSGDVRAMAALQTTARYLGLGLANILHGVDPAVVYIGGEITTAWDIVEPTMRESLVERALTAKIASAVIQPSKISDPRLRGAVALIASPTFAAPRVA